MSMPDYLLRLASNPNLSSLSFLKKQLDEKGVSCGELEYVLGSDLANLISESQETTPIPNVGYVDVKALSSCNSTVFVWGQASSGKTSVVGSILACADDLSFEGDSNVVARTKQLVRMFRESTGEYKVVNTGSSSNLQASLVEIRQRVGLFKKRYPIAFVEVQMNEARAMLNATSCLSNSPEQIHVFCVDCTADIDVQAKRIMSVLDDLNRNGYINRTNGVYIFVTKSDTMYRVPREYREQAAQTLITAGQKALWQRVRNICYEKGIYGATPIVFSIGEVKFQQVVKTDLSAARKALANPVLQKSQPRLTWFVRMLRLFNGKVTTVVFSLLAVLAFYGMFRGLIIDNLPPAGKNIPYDFKADVIHRDSCEIIGNSYKKAEKAYEALRADINKEKTIKTAQGDSLLSSDDVHTCDSVIANDFAVVLHQTVESEMKGKQWNKVLLSGCQKHCKEMKKSAILNEQNQKDISDDYKTIYDYFNVVEPFIAKSKACKSFSEVKEIVENVKKYKIEPYTNNKVTREGLNYAVENALRSYATLLRDDAVRIRNEYDEMAWYDKLLSGTDEIKSRARAVENILNSLSNYADVIGESGANDIINEAINIIRI